MSKDTASVKFTKTSNSTVQKVTLKFISLHDLGECLFLLNVVRPDIDYRDCSFTADLTDEQVKAAQVCGGLVMNDDSYIIQPEDN